MFKGLFFEKNNQQYQQPIIIIIFKIFRFLNSYYYICFDEKARFD
jgi:hypothetical protein